MKLSELKGERAVEVIADLIEPIANIAEDQQNLQLFHAEKLEGETDHEMAVRDLKQKVPNLLRTHKADILTILSTVNEVDSNELSVLDIVKGTVELFSDKDFQMLFFSSVNAVDKTPPTESSANADHSEPE